MDDLGVGVNRKHESLKRRIIQLCRELDLLPVSDRALEIKQGSVLDSGGDWNGEAEYLSPQSLV